MFLVGVHVRTHMNIRLAHVVVDIEGRYRVWMSAEKLNIE